MHVSARLSLTLLLAPFAACSSAEPPPALELGELLEVLGDPLPATSLIGADGAAFLVGEGSESESVLAVRDGWLPQGPRTSLHTVLDVSRLADLERASLGDRLIEPALDGRGPIFLDASGVTSSALRGGRPGIHLVELDSERRVISAREEQPR